MDYGWVGGRGDVFSNGVADADIAEDTCGSDAVFA
jgi:hypothetical protein